MYCFSIVHNFIIISGCAVAVGAAFQIFIQMRLWAVMLWLYPFDAKCDRCPTEWISKMDRCAQKLYRFNTSNRNPTTTIYIWYRRKSHIHANLGGNLCVVVSPCKYGLIDRGWTIECIYMYYIHVTIYYIWSNVHIFFLIFPH